MRHHLAAVVVAMAAVHSPAIGVVSVTPPTTPLSPGGLDAVQEVAGVCPTFSWATNADSTPVELLVYDLDEETSEPSEVVLLESLPGGARSWTPPVGRCLRAGGVYAWILRHEAEEGQSEWSPPRLFRVAEAPSHAEVRQAMAILERYLARAGGEPVAPARIDPDSEVSGDAIHAKGRHGRAAREVTSATAAATLASALAAIRGEMPDTTGETVGVLGVSSSPDGTGLLAANTSGGADLTLDGASHGAQDTALSESGLLVGGSAFSFTNSGGTLVLDLNGDALVTTATDADTLGGLSCANGETAQWNGSSWACTAAGDTLAGLSCANDEVTKWNGSAWVCAADDDTTLSEPEVETFVTNGPLDFAAGSSVGGQTISTGPHTVDTNSGGTVTQVDTGTGLSGGPLTTTGTLSLDTSYTDGRYLSLSGGSLTGDLALEPAGTADATQGYASQGLGVRASVFDGTLEVGKEFRWQADPVDNNDPAATAQLSLRFGTGGAMPTDTGLHVLDDGTLEFAAGQTFPGADTLSGLSCANDEIAKWNGSAWACAIDVDTDTDTLGGLSCGEGLIAKRSGSSWVCSVDDDTIRSESEVETFVTNGAINLAAGSSVGGQTISTGAHTIDTNSQCDDGTCTQVRLDDGTNTNNVLDTTAQALAADPLYWGDETVSLGPHTVDTTLSEPEVETFVTNDALDFAAGSSVGGQTISTGDHTVDTTLSEADVETFVTNGAINLAAGSSVGGQTISTGPHTIDTNSGGTITQVNTGTGLSGGPITTTGTLSLDTSYTDGRYLQGAGGGLTGDLALEATGTADAAQGYPSQGLELQASVFDGTQEVGKIFRWQADPVDNNAPAASARLSLNFYSTGTPPAATGLFINDDGTLDFAAGQTFPSAGDVFADSANTFTEQNIFTATPTGTGVGQGPVYINPATAGTDGTLFGVAVGGVEKLRVDATGLVGAQTLTGQEGQFTSLTADSLSSTSFSSETMTASASTADQVVHVTQDGTGNGLVALTGTLPTDESAALLGVSQASGPAIQVGTTYGVLGLSTDSELGVGVRGYGHDLGVDAEAISGTAVRAVGGVAIDAYGTSYFTGRSDFSAATANEAIRVTQDGTGNGLVALTSTLPTEGSAALLGVSQASGPATQVGTTYGVLGESTASELGVGVRGYGYDLGVDAEAISGTAVRAVGSVAIDASGTSYFSGTSNFSGDLRLTSGGVYLNSDGPDADTSLYFYNASSATGERLLWDDSADQFVFSDSLELQGGLTTTGGISVGNTLGVNGTSLYVNLDGPDGASQIYFYEDSNPFGESIQWDNANDRFNLSDDLNVAGALSKSSGSFKIDHPLAPAEKYLYHSFVESPDMKNVYDGVVELDDDGEAVVELPEWFEALNSDFRYQLTTVGAFAPVYVAEEVEGNRFRIAGGRSGLKVSWQVTGIRQDAWARDHRVQVEEDKPEAELGTYLYPEGFGQPASLALGRNAAPEGGSAELRSLGSN